MNPTGNRVLLGLACAMGAQVVWGLFPLYLQLLSEVDAFDLVAHRLLWAFALLMGWYGWQVATGRARPEPRSGNRRMYHLLGLAAVLIALNWTTFVWAVANERTLDASLGYYICPQVVVLLGVFVLGERLTGRQWVGMLLVAGGVAWLARTPHGVPWPALLIAGSFGVYGLTKKQIRIPALDGLRIECGYLVLPALAWLAYRRWIVGEMPWGSDWETNLLLVGTGLLTVLPLALYATALQHIQLSTVGVLQFLGPTIQFLVGVFLLGEPFDHGRLVGFALVWSGVALYLWQLGHHARRSNSARHSVSPPTPDH